MITEVTESKIYFTSDAVAEFVAAIHSPDPVAGFTHAFYNYPARFSPLFATAAIKLFTQPGDLIIDPFMGGGTTLVEARVLGRRAVGVDISQLATFVARVKTRPLSNRDLTLVADWANNLGEALNLRNQTIRAEEWINNGYQRNINSKSTWPIRKILELAVERLGDLPQEKQQKFARCALLKTGQWALDGRREIPSVEEFREQFTVYLAEMIEGAKAFSTAVEDADRQYELIGFFRTLSLNRSVIGIETDKRITGNNSLRLILTSPPYPGVYVLYHRWKVQGRKETPAPFWVANCQDGSGMAFYTCGDRKQVGLRTYFQQISAAFTSLAKLAKPDTWVVQLVGFSEPSWQLPRYLEVMEQAGFTEVRLGAFENSPDGRLWREIPHRKWYAAYQESTEATSKEVVLFHRLAQR
jgi:hypothetical protein